MYSHLPVLTIRHHCAGEHGLRSAPALSVPAGPYRSITETLLSRPQERKYPFRLAGKPALSYAAWAAETFRHRCGAWSSKPVDGRKVVGRFDSYASPPSPGKQGLFPCGYEGDIQDRFVKGRPPSMALKYRESPVTSSPSQGGLEKF